MAGSVVDIFMVYQFIKRLTTPFVEWDAYKLGIIDDKGNVIKKKLRTVKERRAWGHFDRLVRNIKILLEKVPGGNTRLGSYAAALWLIKEGEDPNQDTLTEEQLKMYMKRASLMFNEEIPANSRWGSEV